MTLNRFIAFAGPYIASASGLVATWLLNNVHLLGVFHFGHDETAAAIAKVLTFVLVTGVTWLGHQQWLKGHHIELAARGVANIPAGK